MHNHTEVYIGQKQRGKAYSCNIKPYEAISPPTYERKYSAYNDRNINSKKSYNAYAVNYDSGVSSYHAMQLKPEPLFEIHQNEENFGWNQNDDYFNLHLRQQPTHGKNRLTKLILKMRDYLKSRIKLLMKNYKHDRPT